MPRRVALLAALTLTLTAAPAAAQATTAQVTTARTTAAHDPGPVRWSATDSWPERRTVLQYWTPQRLRAARPLSSPEPRRTARSDRPTRGNPWATRGTSFTRSAAELANSPGLRWTDGGAIVRTTGRVFFTTAEGQNSSCSGTAVTSANESVVMTAGHCVKLNGAFHRNWVFVPGFANGRAPFGAWVASRLLTTQQWNAREDINFDVAAAVVAPLQGRTLTDVVGGQGVAFNQARRQQMFSYGFPAAEPFDGSSLIFCSGRAFDDSVMTRDLGLRCRMTGGSSGGPWLQGFDDSTGLGWVTSVNSFKYDFAPDFMFGPFFGNEAMAVYQEAQRTDAT
ncbi:serine protease [Nonomuraea sp. ATR24]|uniref:trypsin-like serine peptidase n=1 Tax=Nonomuraea TaxID=83681 RepID=UPI001C5EC5BB|nr:peptidase [Nonomuraea ceibae]